MLFEEDRIVKSLLTLFLVGGAGWIFMSHTVQENEQDEKKPPEFAEQYDQRFLKKKPKIGELLPEFKAFDEAGKPFELKQTRGRYTVLVFGCLT